MSLWIKCDGHDNCQNFDGCNSARVYPLGSEAKDFIREKHSDIVEHLCADCMGAYNEDGDFLMLENAKYSKEICLVSTPDDFKFKSQKGH